MLKHLVNQVKTLFVLGVYDQDELFEIVYQKNRPIHYATVRKAIHLAKVS